jgi:hypothetical protein
MHLIDLYRYLIANNKIEDIHHYNEANLSININKTLQLIKQGETGWEENVPEEVIKMIKDRCLFGFPCVVVPGVVGSPKAMENEQLTITISDV